MEVSKNMRSRSKRFRVVSVSIPEKAKKAGYWEFINLLRSTFKKGVRLINPEIVDGYVRKASEAVPFPGDVGKRTRYFRGNWINIALKMGFLINRKGLRGWVLGDKLVEREQKG